MPFVFGSNEITGFPNKRRKLDNIELTISPTMARYHEGDRDQGRCPGDPNTPYKSDEPQPPHKVEYAGQIVRTSSREELMECIKRGQRPEWVPNASFQALCDAEEALRSGRRLKQKETSPDPESQPTAHSQQQVIPAATAQHSEPYERPRSALHTGDFSEEDADHEQSWMYTPSQPGLAISTSKQIQPSPLSWNTENSVTASFDSVYRHHALSQLNTHVASRRRAPSLGSSLSSSFVMRAPTSPLVHATSNRDLAAYDSDSQQSNSQRDPSRRRTMPPNSFHSFSLASFETTTPNFSRPFAPALRRESSLPLQGHQSRRSLSSFTYHPRSIPQTPLACSRRPSMTSENGSRRRTSMVGSFEESILRGRMSAPASRPFDFVAQIGVMGRGDCPSNLKCPAHVTVPFPAVFYNYPAAAGPRSVSDDAPSPYVGTLDLNRNLKDVSLASGRKAKRFGSPEGEQVAGSTSLRHSEGGEDSEPPKLHVGGAYRVPQQGQLQIIIKNPNKTAVKLFLVPYDLTGMMAGTKTFVRQRSYSTGAIIDSIAGETSSRAAITDPLQNKHILRYLIHLKFCCPAKGRFYLYDDIRVVFANRVPDGKEKLRNEIQLPEPKFSTWKSSKPAHDTQSSQSVPTTPTSRTFQSESPRMFGEMEGFSEMDGPASPMSASQKLDPSAFDLLPIFTTPRSSPWGGHSAKEPQKTPFEFPDIKQTPTPTPTDSEKSPQRIVSPVTGFGTPTPLRGPPTPGRPSSGNSISARSFSPVPPEAKDSLLSKQFKELWEQTHSARISKPAPSSECQSNGQAA